MDVAGQAKFVASLFGIAAVGQNALVTFDGTQLTVSRTHYEHLLSRLRGIDGSDRLKVMKNSAATVCAPGPYGLVTLTLMLPVLLPLGSILTV